MFFCFCIFNNKNCRSRYCKMEYVWNINNCINLGLSRHCNWISNSNILKDEIFAHKQEHFW